MCKGCFFYDPSYPVFIIQQIVKLLNTVHPKNNTQSPRFDADTMTNISIKMPGIQEEGDLFCNIYCPST